MAEQTGNFDDIGDDKRTDDVPGYDETSTTAPAAKPARRRGVDVFTLVFGVATLGVSGYLLSDGALSFPDVDLRWILAGGAVLVGLILLGASLRGGSKTR